jgi:hypothetical protein
MESAGISVHVYISTLSRLATYPGTPIAPSICTVVCRITGNDNVKQHVSGGEAELVELPGEQLGLRA